MDVLFFVALALLVGFLAGKVVNKVKLPGVLGYLVAGVLFGPSALNVFGEGLLERFDFFPAFALSLVAFIIGSEMKLKNLRAVGRGLGLIIILESLGAFALVALGIYFLTGQLFLALILGALAPASAPAGTVAVLQECRSKGRLTNALYAVVGLDDGLAIMIFAVASAVSRSVFTGGQLSMLSLFEGPVFEIAGSIALGGLMGLAVGFLMRKMAVQHGILVVSIAAILLCTGIAVHFELSLILANLSLGVVSVNFFPYANKKAYQAIESISLPVYIIFFFLAGASLQIRLLPSMGLIGLVYIICRTMGLIGGAYFGAVISRLDRIIRNYLGLGILSQAGVAVGLAILAASQFEKLGQQGTDVAVILLNTIAATTIVFEIIGPIGTKYAVTKVGEVGADITEEDLIQTYRSADVMDTTVPTIEAGALLSEVIRLVGDTNSFYYPVVDSAGEVIGTISLDTIRKTFTADGLSHWLVALDIMEPVVLKATPDTPLSETLDNLKQLGLEYAPVVSQENNTHLGVINVHDVHRRLGAKVLEKHQEVYAAKPA